MLAPRTHGQILQADFRPYPLLSNAHLQTVVPAKLRPTPALQWRMERWELPDGDFVDLGWAGSDQPDAPSAILIHGLTGGLDSKYLRGTALALIDHGWRVVALQLRGGGEQPNRLPRSYHHADTADLRRLWHRLRAQEPEAFVGAIGWSLGGNVLLKALGEEGDQAPLDAACAVSVPFRLRDCAVFLRQGVARAYQHHLLERLKQMLRLKLQKLELPPPADAEKALAARDFFEYDDAFTAPLNGYADVEDYYARAACGQFLKHIRTPTTIFQALDDPFMPPDIIPTADQLAADVQIRTTAKGGHVGFMARGAGLKPAWWLQHALVDTLQSARLSTVPRIHAKETAA